jgi:hypothetical protein
MILFLDIDGVLAPFNASKDSSFSTKLGINWLPALKPELDRLCEVYAPIWASWWQEDSYKVGKLYDLPPTGFCRFSDHFDDFEDLIPLDWKLPAMGSVAAGRPFVWVDDEITDYAFEWAYARDLTVPTKFFRTDGRVGLTRDLCDEIYEWGCARAKTC